MQENSGIFTNTPRRYSAEFVEHVVYRGVNGSIADDQTLLVWVGDAYDARDAILQAETDISRQRPARHYRDDEDLYGRPFVRRMNSISPAPNYVGPLGLRSYVLARGAVVAPKACPFCGVKPQINRLGAGGAWVFAVTCENSDCQASPIVTYGSENPTVENAEVNRLTAIQQWNDMDAVRSR